MTGEPGQDQATAAEPLLRLHDVGPGGPVGRPALPPWQTRLTVLARLSAESLQLIAAADLVLAIGEEIETVPLRHKVKLQLGMMVHCVGATVMAIMPDVAIQGGGQFEFLAHDDKK